MAHSFIPSEVLSCVWIIEADSCHCFLHSHRVVSLLFLQSPHPYLSASVLLVENLLNLRSQALILSSCTVAGML